LAAAHDPGLGVKLARVCEGLRSPSGAAAAVLGVERLAHRLLINPRTTMLATRMFRALTKRGVVTGSSSSCEFQPVEPDGFFTGMSAGQARAGVRGLARLDQNLAHRRKISAYYEEALRKAGLATPGVPEGATPVYVRYPVRVKDKAAVLRQAAAHRLEIGSWFESPLHPAETPLELYGYRLGMCPEAERAAREVVNLPTHPGVSLREAARVVEQVGPRICATNN
jgi:perosamine synthetase